MPYPRDSLSRFVQSGPDAEDVVFAKLRRLWREDGEHIVVFRRKDVPNDFKWLEYQADATAIYGKRGK